MTKGEDGDQVSAPTTEVSAPTTQGNGLVQELAEQIGSVTKQLPKVVSQQGQIAAALKQLEELLSNRTSGRERVLAAIRAALYVSIVLVTLGFAALLGTLALLESMHVNHNAAAAVSNALTNAGSTALTPTDVRWPVSALGWAAAIGFLAFAACVAGIVAAMAASVSRLFGEGL